MAHDIPMESSPATMVNDPIPAIATQRRDKSSVTITKPIPHTFDLGNLLCNDTNPLPPTPTSQILASTARDCAQSLINQLLTTCPIHTDPKNGILMTLPPPTTPLPREKRLPPEKQQTKWEKFAAKKGIKDKKRGEGKMVFEEETGEWKPKWGYKGRNKDGEGEWIVEVDEEREKEREGEGKGRRERGEGRRERMEKVKRNERKQRNNERKVRKGGGGG